MDRKWSDIAVIDVIVAAFLAVHVVGVFNYVIVDLDVVCCCLLLLRFFVIVVLLLFLSLFLLLF